jgi:hypothetical protein
MLEEFIYQFLAVSVMSATWNMKNNTHKLYAIKINLLLTNDLIKTQPKLWELVVSIGCFIRVYMGKYIY